MGALLFSFCAVLFTNTLGWLVSALLATDKLYDLLGSISFLLCVLCARLAGATASAASPRAVAAAWMLGLWAARLGSFLFLRVLRAPDERLTAYLSDPLLFLVPWAGQAAWAYCSSLPVLSLHSWGAPLPWGARDSLLLGAWAVCALGQAVADEQKRAFRAVKRNRAHFITTGLWRYSRHPNYFFQICSSWLLAAFCAAPLVAVTSAGWLVCLAPALETFLLLRVSGVPLLERAGRRKWGGACCMLLPPPPALPIPPRSRAALTRPPPFPRHSRALPLSLPHAQTPGSTRSTACPRACSSPGPPRP